MKYSDLLAEWLAEMGYTTCFFVAGGNIMHALESFRRRFAMRPTVHEVCAGIAAEYFNEISTEGKAFVLVTAGPGMTNLVTALAGAWLESRELLVIGGQVKTSDLSRGHVRQRGIQEIDGVALAAPCCVAALRMEQPQPREEWQRLVNLTRNGRRGPVFVELPLDVQARSVTAEGFKGRFDPHALMPTATDEQVVALAAAIRQAQRPAILIGGGVSRKTAWSLRDALAKFGVPLLTTWNGADRVTDGHPLYFGRPNTWGQRSANLILQQSDELLVLGSRLGLQQTGFNWQEFAPGARVTQVDIDSAELSKGHPRVARSLAIDANDLLEQLVQQDVGYHDEWVAYCRDIRAGLPQIEACNSTREGYLSPHEFVAHLSRLADEEDVVIPCSSGGALTVTMQTFAIRAGQVMVTNKGLAAMGYGLSGAIGAALAFPRRRTLLLEGDGGFAQNLQEIGTAVVNRLNLKIFIFDDGGYASIRMTQKNYFKGDYIGCDTQTGLGLPQWPILFSAYGVPAIRIGPGFEQSAEFQELFDAPGVAAFLVHLDPEQTYFPKITSRVAQDGSMASEPLHRMSPPLGASELQRFGRYLPRE